MSVHECNLCFKAFKQAGHLKSHLSSVHQKLKPYDCKQCEKSFTTFQNLKVHKSSVHGKIQPYECNPCGQFFTQAGNLKRHNFQVHSTEEKTKIKIRKNQCPHCLMQFKFPDNLNCHVESVHTKKSPAAVDENDEFADL